MMKKEGLIEIARQKQLDLDGLQEALTFAADFNNCLRGPHNQLEQALAAFFAKYDAIFK
jgi:hypothetical protein